MKLSIIITIVMLVVGTILYFNFAEIPPSNEFYTNLKIKAAFTEKGELKIFAFADNIKLSRLRLKEGKNLKEYEKNSVFNSIILGYKEAEMMREERLFLKIGDEIKNFFGADIFIGGILKKTGTIIDDMHFMSEETYKKIKGEENRIFIKLKDGMPKVFYTYSVGKKPELNLKEGYIKDYNIKIIDNKTYYPIIIGSDEAEMMRDEKLFKNTGDKIENFFGVNVIVVGIVEKTNTSIDMIHFLPLSESELN